MFLYPEQFGKIDDNITDLFASPVREVSWDKVNDHVSPASLLIVLTRARREKDFPPFVTLIPNNGVSYMFYYERDILTPSDYVFQAKAYRSWRKYLL